MYLIVTIVVLQEAAELLKGEELEKTRAQTAQATPTSPTTPTRVKRTSTISQTTEVSKHVLPTGGDHQC